MRTMLSLIAAFLLGVFLAPAVRPLFRPVLVEVIRAGLVVSDEVRRMSHTVREGVEDVQAEAQAARAAPTGAASAPAEQATAAATQTGNDGTGSSSDSAASAD